MGITSLFIPRESFNCVAPFGVTSWSFFLLPCTFELTVPGISLSRQEFGTKNVLRLFSV